MAHGGFELAKCGSNCAGICEQPQKRDYDNTRAQEVAHDAFQHATKTQMRTIRSRPILDQWDTSSSQSTYIRNCTICTIECSKLSEQLMAGLPVSRARKLKPFTHCGVSYAGLISIIPHGYYAQRLRSSNRLLRHKGSALGNNKNIFSNLR